MQEERQVVLAARREEPDHRLVASDGVDAAGGSRGKRRVASMAYDEPPQTLRTARAAAPSPRRARVEGRTQRADISCLDSDPPWSLSMSWKHSRAAFLNSNVNSSISLLAALASSSRALARCSSLAASAVSIASSLRGTSTGEPRRTSTPPARHHRSTPSPRRRRPKVSGSETRHSMASIVPSLSVSSTANAASSRDGTNRYWRFLLPQFVRKLMTS